MAREAQAIPYNLSACATPKRDFSPSSNQQYAIEFPVKFSVLWSLKVTGSVRHPPLYSQYLQAKTRHWTAIFPSAQWGTDKQRFMMGFCHRRVRIPVSAAQLAEFKTLCVLYDLISCWYTELFELCCISSNIYCVFYWVIVLMSVLRVPRLIRVQYFILIEEQKVSHRFGEPVIVFRISERETISLWNTCRSLATGQANVSEQVGMERGETDLNRAVFFFSHSQDRALTLAGQE